MAVFTKTVEIDFSNPRQKSIRDWLAETGNDPKSLPSLKLNVSINAFIDDFDEEEVAERYEELFPLGDDDTRAIGRAYRYLAEGDTAAAMEELANHFGLAPPSHERAIADLLSSNRTSAHAQG